MVLKRRSQHAMSLMTESSLKQAIAQVAATRAVEWRVSDAPVVYPDAMAAMDARR
jgi:hypothetical protein